MRKLRLCHAGNPTNAFLTRCHCRQTPQKNVVSREHAGVSTRSSAGGSSAQVLHREGSARRFESSQPFYAAQRFIPRG
jgi:hypothetical protein